MCETGKGVRLPKREWSQKCNETEILDKQEKNGKNKKREDGKGSYRQWRKVKR